MRISITVIFVLAVLAFGAIFLLSSPTSEEGIVNTNEEVVFIENQGGSMEGHTPRGFAGSGEGLFAGDNLNPGFPNGDGVQFFLTFDISDAPTEFTSVELSSSDMHTIGTPFEDLGALGVERVRYERFSPALFNATSAGFVCELTVSEGEVSCDVTQAVLDEVSKGSSMVQFRVRFESAGDSDNSPDLAMFYKTDSNTNERGIFFLSFSSELPMSTIRIPVILHIVSGEGATASGRDVGNVTNLFERSREIWRQAHIEFDAEIKEAKLGAKEQEALHSGSIEPLRALVEKNAVNVFFVRTLNGINGIAVNPNIAVIADRTTVNDFRATAHEIGHLLGLSHVSDGSFLMFQGANGTLISEEEAKRARAFAQADYQQALDLNDIL